MNFCLPRDRVEAFVNGLKSGELDPEKMASMTSEERRTLIGKYVGEDASKAVNAEFESKLLLKNQNQGFKTFIEKTVGLKPEAKRDLIAKVAKMQDVLDPTDKDAFLKDLVSRRLGTDVTSEEAQSIANLSKKVSDYKELQKPDKTFPSEEDRLNYGRSVEDLTDYVAELKKSADNIQSRDLLKPSTAGRIVNKTAGNLKSINASLDDSAIFKQGWKTLFTNPKIWTKNAAKSLSDIARVLGGKNILREVNADIISRPNYDKYVKGGLAIKNPEEAFPESLLDKANKIPGVKNNRLLNFFPTVLTRLYKASEQAYTGFLYRTRADVMDKMLNIAKNSGVNVDDKDQLKAIGKMINSLTGRGDLGKLEPVANVVNNVFFSPRLLKSNFDTLTAHQLQKDVTPFVRKQAALNLVKVVGGTATILGIANALTPGSVDWDPRSTDFGKIKIGDTRFDVTGGSGSLVTFLVRELSGQSKSSGGVVTDLRNPVYGGQNEVDALVSFLRNKLSPASSLAVNSFTGTNNIGQKTNFLNELGKSVTPLGVQNIIELANDPNSAGVFAGEMADFFGISANSYGATQNNSWQDSTAKDLQAFKDKVGDTEFQQANQDYDNQYNTYANKITKTPDFVNASDEDKQYILATKKANLKDQVLKDHGFTYKATKQDRSKDKALVGL